MVKLRLVRKDTPCIPSPPTTTSKKIGRPSFTYSSLRAPGKLIPLIPMLGTIIITFFLDRRVSAVLAGLAVVGWGFIIAYTIHHECQPRALKTWLIRPGTRICTGRAPIIGIYDESADDYLRIPKDDYNMYCAVLSSKFISDDDKNALVDRVGKLCENARKITDDGLVEGWSRVSEQLRTLYGIHEEVSEDAARVNRQIERDNFRLEMEKKQWETERFLEGF